MTLPNWTNGNKETGHVALTTIDSHILACAAKL